MAMHRPNPRRVLYALFAGYVWDVGHARLGEGGSFIPFLTSALLVAATSLLAVGAPEAAAGKGEVAVK
jgi:hypothetical protein